MCYNATFQSLHSYFSGISMVDPRSASVMFRRNVSAEWLRGGYTSIDPSGFNPFYGKVFYSRNSCLDELREGVKVALPNIDLFKYEVFYALHDFVHIWSMHELAAMNSDSIGSWERIQNIDPVWFKILLLFSEAAATVTVDYWMLCDRPLSTQPTGVNAFTTLTTPFTATRDYQRIENNRHNVNIKSPSFLVQLAFAYCVEWSGPLDDLMKSFDDNPPAWLVREKNQAQRQNRLANMWLATLRGKHHSEAIVEPERFNALEPHLLNIATDLLNWINSGYIRQPKIHAPIAGWCNEQPNVVDFRFINALCWLERGGLLGEIEMWGDNLPYFNAQMISRIRPCVSPDFSKMHPGRTLADISADELFSAIRDSPRIYPKVDCPLNLFFVS